MFSLLLAAMSEAHPSEKDWWHNEMIRMRELVVTIRTQLKGFVVYAYCISIIIFRRYTEPPEREKWFTKTLATRRAPRSLFSTPTIGPTNCDGGARTTQYVINYFYGFTIFSPKFTGLHETHKKQTESLRVFLEPTLPSPAPPSHLPKKIKRKTLPLTRRSKGTYVGIGRHRIVRKHKLFTFVPKTLSYGGGCVVATLAFSQQLSLSEISPAVGTHHAWIMNTAYNPPNAAREEVQLLGFNEMMARYRKCLVYYARFEWSVANSTAHPLVVGFWIVPNMKTAPTDAATWPSLPGGQMETLQANTGGPSAVHFSKICDFSEEFRVPMQTIFDELDYTHGSTTQPKERLMAYIWIRGFEGGRAKVKGSVLGQVRITMRCRFTEARILEDPI